MRKFKTAVAIVAVALWSSLGLVITLESQAQSSGRASGPETPQSIARNLDVQSHLDAFRQAHPGTGIGTWKGVSSIYGAAFSQGPSAVASAENFRLNGMPMFGIAADELQPSFHIEGAAEANDHTLPLMFNPATGAFKFTAVYYKQQRAGVDVYGSRLMLLTRNENNHPLVLANVHLRDLGTFQVDPVAAAKFNPAPSFANAVTVLGQGAKILTDPRAVIWAGIDEMVEPARLALVFNAEGGDVLQGTYQAYEFVTDIATGAVLHQESLIHDVDVSGTISGMATTGDGADICGGIAPMPLPYAKASIGGTSVFADPKGNFTIPNAGATDVTVEARLQGQYFNVINTASPGGGNTVLSQVVTPPGPADFMFNDLNDSQFKRAEVNAYVEANRVRDYVLFYNPAYPVIAGETNFTTNVNINQTCNAFYSSANQSINFYISGGACSNTANSTVVHHEYGHRLINAAGSGQGAYGEGMSDCIAVMVTDQSCLGDGFNQPCGPPGGCLRNADNDCQYSAASCTSNCGGPNHPCGRLLSGCVWDTRMNLFATNPVDYRDIYSTLVINSIPLHTGTGITPQITIDFLTLDDDDANLLNGTPHYNQINNAFTDHNMPGPPITEAIIITPSTGTTHQGIVGGPYTNDPYNYSLENNTVNPANYTVSINPGGTAPLLFNGMSPPIGGTLAGTEVANLAVSVDPSANALPAGIYSSTVNVADTTNNVAYDVVHVLEIGQVGFTTTPANSLISGGPVGGPFNATQVYTLTSTKPTPVTVRVEAGANWISLDGGSGPVDMVLNGIGASANVTVGFSAAANALPAGEVNSSVTFTNIGSGGSASDTSRVVTLDVGRFTYASIDTPITICDLCQNIVSSVNVPDGYCVGDVDVQVDITHTYIGDLTVELISPQGTVVRLHNRTGGSANDIHKLYSDEGPNVPDGPGALSNFDGVSVAGTWQLRISDLAGGDVGTLDSWQLKIAAAGEECPPVANNVAVTVPVLLTSDIQLDAVSTVGNLNYIIMSTPVNGQLFDPNGGAIVSLPYTLLGMGDIVRYKPDPTFAGPDGFAYKANDGQDSNIAGVAVTVGGPQLAHSFNMDVNPNWTYGGGAGNMWAWGPPAGLSGDPNSGHTGANVLGYNLSGDYVNNMPEYTVTSTAIDCSELSGVLVKFWRWLGVERSQYDFARFQVSNDGTTWTTIFVNPVGSSMNETAWTQQSYDVSAVADGQATVYLRWTMGTTDVSVIYHGWNIDDVEVWGISPPCQADITGDGTVGVSDLLEVINSWGPCGPPCPADVDPPGGDGTVGVPDMLIIINGWGDCP